jgi:hypothetical protein
VEEVEVPAKNHKVHQWRKPKYLVKTIKFTSGGNQRFLVKTTKYKKKPQFVEEGTVRGENHQVYW